MKIKLHEITIRDLVAGKTKYAGIVIRRKRDA